MVALQNSVEARFALTLNPLYVGGAVKYDLWWSLVTPEARELVGEIRPITDRTGVEIEQYLKPRA